MKMRMLLVFSLMASNIAASQAKNDVLVRVVNETGEAITVESTFISGDGMQRSSTVENVSIPRGKFAQYVVTQHLRLSEIKVRTKDEQLCRPVRPTNGIWHCTIEKECGELKFGENLLQDSEVQRIP